MDSWKVATPEIRSRCGFCGAVLESWANRVDHLAEHFKRGSDMKDWKGDWGFEPMVLSIVENALPPCKLLSRKAYLDYQKRERREGLIFPAIGLINNERATPLPYQASHRPADSPRSAYELIKIELTGYLQNMAGPTPSEGQMQHEACRIIYALEASSRSGLGSRASWLRDLLMSSDKIQRRAQLGPIRGIAENCQGQLKINGKYNIFDDCPLENQLIEFVKARTLLGLTVTDDELQAEACNILNRMEESSILRSEEVANFMLRLVQKDQSWLCSFRRRADLPDSADSMESKGENSVDMPSDDELRRQARCVVHKYQDSWGQTAADNLAWLNAFKQRQSQQHNNQASPPNSDSPPTTHELSTSGANAAETLFSPFNPGLAISSGLTTTSSIIRTDTNSPVNIEVPQTYATGASGRNLHLLLNGAGNYPQVVKQLVRYVASCMSSNNPAQHTPTDEEIRHQARWIMYDE